MLKYSIAAIILGLIIAMFGFFSVVKFFGVFILAVGAVGVYRSIYPRGGKG